MLDTKNIVTLVVAGVVALVWAILELKRWGNDRKRRRDEEQKRRIEEENDLLPNPTRCADHESRLREVEKSCHEVSMLKASVGEIRADVKTLIALHMEKK